MTRGRTGLAWGTGSAILLASAAGLFLLMRDDGRVLLELLAALEAQVLEAPLRAMAAFVVLMTVTTCLTLPTATVLCLSGGYLFGASAGAVLAWSGALAGALLTFLSIRLIAGDRVRRFLLRGRGAHLIDLIERDAFFYLLALRVVPIAPFFAINAAGAMLRISPGRFALATGLGLVPLMSIYAGVGAGVETLVDAQQLDGWSLLRQPRVIGPLAGLLALLLAGWLFRRRLIRRQRSLPAEDAV